MPGNAATTQRRRHAQGQGTKREGGGDSSTSRGRAGGGTEREAEGAVLSMTVGATHKKEDSPTPVSVRATSREP